MKLNKKLISLSTLALLVFSLFLVSCEDDTSGDNVIGGVDYIGIEAAKFVWIPDGETVTVEASVFASRAASADRTINLMVREGSSPTNVPDADPANYTVPSSVTIPAGEMEGVFNVTMEATDFEKKKVVIELMPDPSFNIAVTDYEEVELEDGTIVSEELEYGRLIIFAQRPCLDTIVTLALTTDDYPEETSWELYDLSGAPTVIFSGGTYPNDPNTTLYFDFCLSSGPYGIVVYDSWGDGIVGGGYEITADGTVLTSGPVVGTGSSSTFDVD